MNLLVTPKRRTKCMVQKSNLKFKKKYFLYLNVCIFRQQSEDKRVCTDASRHSVNLFSS
jgi:hypothetical protein